LIKIIINYYHTFICPWSSKTLKILSNTFIVFSTPTLMVREPFPSLWTKLRVSDEDLVFSSAKFWESTQNLEPENSQKDNVMPLLTSSTIPKDMEYLNGSSTDKKTTERARTFKSLPTSLKLNSERTLKDSSRSDPTKVWDTNGDLKLEVNTLKQPAEEEKLWE